MEEEDLASVIDIERDSFASPWSREHFLFELHDNRWAINRVARTQAQIVGYACVWHCFQELRINNIAVRADSRARGVGRWMLAQVLREGTEADCRTAVLEVRPSNAAAIRLYAGFGFRPIGRRKNYYAREGEDALVMELTLAPSSK
jgi:ribosomal-protein-alanine N-acetyltransferase